VHGKYFGNAWQVPQTSIGTPGKPAGNMLEVDRKYGNPYEIRKSIPNP